MNYELLGHNIQTIRKRKGLTQQELSDQIGINLQSLSKIERGVNYPTFDTLEKLMDALQITPNELLSGPLKSTAHIESDIMKFLQKEEYFNMELAHGQYDSPLDKDQWIKYELEQLREYITDYINSEKRSAADLYPLKQLIQSQKFQKILSRYDDYLCYDVFGETVEGHQFVNPYVKETVECMVTDDDGNLTITQEFPDDFEF